ncbi:MAG: hypothetical protein R3293_14635, partial [Candidatus Promineifilaceae bacterium]|nr:hypothetical protein [Candidatus Promineifilaceae bacterium]
EDHGLAILWDIATGERRQTFEGHVQTIKRVKLSPDESRLLTAAWDGTARLWDVATGEELFLLGDHSGPVWGASYHPDGRMVATGAIDSAIILWDAHTGAKLLTLMEGGDEGINHVDFHPDGTRLIAAVGDGTLREFILPLAELVELAHTRVTRTLTDEECRQYLHVDACPQS